MNYADIVCDLPFIEKDFEMLDSSVPIIQMVISGMLQYTGIEFNAADNIDVFLAKSALSGAGLQVTYNEASPDALKASQLESLFASNYSYYKETYKGIISGYLEKTAAVAGRELIRYSALTDNVGLSVFDNGKAVIANFSNASYSYNGTQVAPNSFEIVEVQK